MVEYGALKDGGGAQAREIGSRADSPRRRRTTGQYFLDYVQQTLEAKYGADMVFKGGLSVYTTLDPTIQLAAEQTLRDGLKTLEGRSAKARPVSTPRAPSSPSTRRQATSAPWWRIRLLPQRVQPRGAGQAPAGLGLQALRLPGGSRGGLHARHPHRRRAVSYAVGPNRKPGSPRTTTGIRGLTTLQQGLEESVNVVTVKLQERVGGIARSRSRGAWHPEPTGPQPVPRPGDVGPLPARADLGLRHPRQPGRLGSPDRHSLRDRRPRQAAEENVPRAAMPSRPRWPTWSPTCFAGWSSGARDGPPGPRPDRWPRRREPPMTTRTRGSSGTRPAW